MEELTKKLEGARLPLLQARDSMVRKIDALVHTEIPSLDKTAQAISNEIAAHVSQRGQFESARKQLVTEIMPILNKRLHEERVRQGNSTENIKQTERSITDVQAQIKAARLRIAHAENRQGALVQAAQRAVKELKEEKEKIEALRLELRYVTAPTPVAQPRGESESQDNGPTLLTKSPAALVHHRRSSNARSAHLGTP